MDKIEFRRKLLVSYLNSLSILDKSAEFQRFYSEIEDSLKEIITESTDLEYLNKVKNVISYKMKSMQMKI